MWCFGYDITIPEHSQSDLKSSGIEGDTPVDKVEWDLIISRVVVLGSGQRTWVKVASEAKYFSRPIVN